jgi:hypothetical protein
MNFTILEQLAIFNVKIHLKSFDFQIIIIFIQDTDLNKYYRIVCSQIKTIMLHV